MPYKDIEQKRLYNKERLRQIREKKYVIQDAKRFVVPTEQPKKPVVIVHRHIKIKKKPGATNENRDVVPKDETHYFKNTGKPMTITLLDGRVLPLRRRISL